MADWLANRGVVMSNDTKWTNNFPPVDILNIVEKQSQGGSNSVEYGGNN